jgi:hypothetical protein
MLHWLSPLLCSHQRSLGGKKKSYDRNQTLHDLRGSKLPWPQAIIGLNGNNHQAQFMFCTRIKGKEKLLAPKVDGPLKHACRQKARVEIVDVCKSGEYYVSK